jgi:hypothetical protein
MTIDERIPPEVRDRARPASTDSAAPPDDRVARRKRDAHRWARWIHVYSSMLALLLMLFFGITGITLNHPSWTFGDETEVITTTGTLPFETTFDDGTTDYLTISEYVRDEHGVGGQVDSFTTTNGEASIAYRNAGYGADLFVDIDDATYELTVEQQGWVGVMNDLHKGRDTTTLWKWVIDISAAFLVVISLTGLTMQFFLRKRRRSALLAVGGGAVLMLALMAFTLG